MQQAGCCHSRSGHCKRLLRTAADELHHFSLCLLTCCADLFSVQGVYPGRCAEFALAAIPGCQWLAACLAWCTCIRLRWSRHLFGWSAPIQQHRAACTLAGFKPENMPAVPGLEVNGVMAACSGWGGLMRAATVLHARLPVDLPLPRLQLSRAWAWLRRTGRAPASSKKVGPETAHTELL